MEYEKLETNYKMTFGTLLSQTTARAPKNQVACEKLLQSCVTVHPVAKLEQP